MFVESCVVVPLAFEAARDAFDAALADGGFVAESRRAIDHGVACLGCADNSQSISAHVHVRACAVRRFTRSILVELRWESTGVARRFFPSLDGDLVLAPRNRDDTGMSIVAYYRPPLAATSRDFDDLAMSAAIREALDAFLTETMTRLIAIGWRNKLNVLG